MFVLSYIYEEMQTIEILIYNIYKVYFSFYIEYTNNLLIIIEGRRRIWTALVAINHSRLSMYR